MERRNARERGPAWLMCPRQAGDGRRGGSRRGDSQIASPPNISFGRRSLYWRARWLGRQSAIDGATCENMRMFFLFWGARSLSVYEYKCASIHRKVGKLDCIFACCVRASGLWCGSKLRRHQFHSWRHIQIIWCAVQIGRDQMNVMVF